MAGRAGAAPDRHQVTWARDRTRPRGPRRRLGFSKTIEEIFPGSRHQRRWVHKTANVLNKVALSVQVNMKADLRAIYGAINVFAGKYGAKYEKAVARLTKDREALLAFFDFRAEHWDHLRTSNPIESVFAPVRHRTVRTKGSLSARTAKPMVFKLVTAVAKTWRRLKGENQLKSSKESDFKTASRSSKCRPTTPPDRPRHPISLIAPAHCCRSASHRLHGE
jgi:transposase-like protein